MSSFVLFMYIYVAIGMYGGQQTALDVILGTPVTSFETKLLIGQELADYARLAASRGPWHSYLCSEN